MATDEDQRVGGRVVSGEPKTLTPERAVELARLYLDKYLDADNWYEEPVEKWPEQLEADYRLLLEGGVPVVARDEAAAPKPIGWDDVTDEDVMAALVQAQTEASVLRKAIREWAGAVTKLNALIHGIAGHRDDVNAADDRLTAAEAALRRLAGGENEK